MGSGASDTPSCGEVSREVAEYQFKWNIEKLNSIWNLNVAFGI